MTGRRFDLAHFLLGLVIIRGVPAATRVPLATFIANIVSGVFKFFSFRIYSFRSLVTPGSSTVLSGSC